WGRHACAGTREASRGGSAVSLTLRALRRCGMMHPYRRWVMRFGIFMAPFHRVGENPTLALQRDLELIQWLDYLGFDEAWIGEHHSAGWEFVGAPEIMMMAAAERTRTIKLGTGVVSLPY